jgi:hypothetical protein
MKESLENETRNNKKDNKKLTVTQVTARTQMK